MSDITRMTNAKPWRWFSSVVQFKGNSVGAFCLSIDVNLPITASAVVITSVDGSCIKPAFIVTRKGYGLPEVFEPHRVRSTMLFMNATIASMLERSLYQRLTPEGCGTM